MTGAELLRMADELDAYYRAFDDCVARREGRRWLRVYARGQLGPIERKSLEPIADAEGVAPRTLQWFFRRNGWDENQVLAVHQRRVAEELGGADGIFVIDETSDAKKGEWTAGVARQYCGESGKLDNCIVSVHIAYVRGQHHALLDGDMRPPRVRRCGRSAARKPVGCPSSSRPTPPRALLKTCWWRATRAPASSSTS